MTRRFVFPAICLAVTLSIGSALRPSDAVAAATATEGAELSATSTDEPQADTGAAGPVAPSSPEGPAKEPSEAERIIQIQRVLEANEKRLGELRTSLTDAENEHNKAEAAFKQLDDQLQQQKQTQDSPDGVKSNSTDGTPSETEALDKKWTLAKERFDLAIQRHKATQDGIVALEEKLDKDRKVLDKLLGNEKPPAAPDPAVAVVPQPSAEPPVPQAEPDAASTAAPAPQPAVVAGSTAVGTEAVAPPAKPEQAVEEPTTDAATPVLATGGEKAPSRELTEAARVARQTAVEAQAAEDKALDVTKRIANLNKSIESERLTRKTARKSEDNARESLRNLYDEERQKTIEGKDVAELRRQVREAEERVRDEQMRARRAGERLDDLQSELNSLQAELLLANNEAAEKRLEAEKAKKAEQELRNPYTIRNILQWLINHGPPVLAILVATGIFLWLSRFFESRLVQRIVSRGSRGSRRERENRARTLLGVFRNATSLLVTVGGVAMILEEVGVPIAPLLGGAAVFGLAVAFGAQSLIKDYFTGFMILLEQQYLISDVIKIGDTAGQVERITLRTTVLRDLEGRVHFIPHGQITTVTNLTHGWSNAVFDIGVAYKEDVDRVIDVLVQLGKELRTDAEYRDLILEDPTMLGVDAFGDSSVVIKFLMKTRPLQQWTVKREMMRRIKNRFDELGIEIPFPHRIVFNRHEAAGDERKQDSQDGWQARDVA